MDESPKPALTKEQRLVVEWHRAKKQIAELKHELAERDAAIASLFLTREREDLAAEIETPEWRYDWDRYEFVRRG